MENIHSSTDLDATILRLERRQREEGKLVREQFQEAYESIRPINLIKNTVREAAASHELTGNLATISVNLVGGYLAQALFAGVSNKPVKKLLSKVVILGITQAIANNPQLIHALGRGIAKLASSRKPAPDKRANNQLAHEQENNGYHIPAEMPT